jgi:hypothetical protein
VKFKTKGLKQEVDEQRGKTPKVERGSEHNDDVRGRVIAIGHNGPGLRSFVITEVLLQDQVLHHMEDDKLTLFLKPQLLKILNCQKQITKKVETILR